MEKTMSTTMDIFEIFTGPNGVFLDTHNQTIVPGWFFSMAYMPWAWAAVGSALVGLSGVLPLLVIPMDQTDNLKQGGRYYNISKMCSITKEFAYMNFLT